MLHLIHGFLDRYVTLRLVMPPDDTPEARPAQRRLLPRHRRHAAQPEWRDNTEEPCDAIGA
jgi:hypothetical protein